MDGQKIKYTVSTRIERVFSNGQHWEKNYKTFCTRLHKLLMLGCVALYMWCLHCICEISGSVISCSWGIKRNTKLNLMMWSVYNKINGKNSLQHVSMKYVFHIFLGQDYWFHFQKLTQFSLSSYDHIITTYTFDN